MSQMGGVSAEPRHEPEGTRIGIVLLAAGVVIASILISLLVVWWLMLGYGAESSVAPPVRAPVSPDVTHWVGPREDFQASLDAQRRRISGYAWIDRELGVVQIPIERAMRLLAERGAAPTPATTPATPPPATTPAAPAPATAPAAPPATPPAAGPAESTAPRRRPETHAGTWRGAARPTDATAPRR